MPSSDTYPTTVKDEANGYNVSLQGILRLGYDGYFARLFDQDAYVKSWTVPKTKHEMGGKYAAACPQVLFFAFPYQSYLARHGQFGAQVSSSPHWQLGYGVNVMQFEPDGHDISWELAHFPDLPAAIRFATQRILALCAVAKLNQIMERGGVKLDAETHDMHFMV